MRRRDWLFAAGVALLASAGAVAAGSRTLDGLSIDLLFWLREHALPSAHRATDSPTVVVAIDEETYHRPPFANIPNALWTHELATVLDAIVAASPEVVGFDVIYPASIERVAPGFDRDFLLALRRAAQAGKVVLGEVQHQEFPIHPFPAQSFAVGNEKNIRSVNLFRDADEVIRRAPLTFEKDDGKGGVRTEPSMVLELAARAGAVDPTPLADGALALAGRRIPGSERNAILLNFEGGDAIPAYSLADLQACAERGDAAFFRDHFAGKVVLIGAVLDVEDRKLTSKRFITAPERPATAPRCVYPPMANLFREDLVRDSIPGVYVLATAVNNLLRGDALRELDPLPSGGFVLILALAAAAVTMRLPPLAAGAALLGGIALWATAATLVFRLGLVLPLLTPPLAAGPTLAVLLGYRFAVTDRDKRLLRGSFALYLAPSLIDRMLAADRLPELGGELRTVTVLFSDLAGFANLSERLAPAELVALMNEYLTAMTDIIEGEGGFVEKYIGDAIAAVFGAPLDDAQHALHAARAALACRDRLEALNREAAAFRGHRLQARIGLSTGEALVGNIGSRRRFNYTAMGDAVNLAARLEGANKVYGTAILAAEATRLAAADAIAWREIDRVRVVGRGQPVTIYEPLALAGAARPEQTEVSTAFAAGLAEYRAGRFDAAAHLFDALATRDSPARVFAERARRCLASPPPQPWDAVTTLESK